MLKYNMVLSYQTLSTPTYFLSLLYHATSRMMPLLPPTSPHMVFIFPWKIGPNLNTFPKIS